jgi:hypothetical protein
MNSKLEILTLAFIFLTLVGSAYAIQNTVFSDIDGDGDLDMFLEVTIQTRNGTTFYYRNATDGIGNVANLKQGYFVDVNGDTREDLYIVRSGAPNYLFLWNGSFRFRNVTNSSLGRNLSGGAGAPLAAAFDDFNNDGNVDAFVNGQLFMNITNLITFVNATNVSNVDEIPDLAQVKIEDINADGWKDIIGARTTGAVVVFLSLGDSNGDGVPEFYDATQEMHFNTLSNVNFVEAANIPIGLAVNRTISYYPFNGTTAPFITDQFADIYLARTAANQLLVQLFPDTRQDYSVFNASMFYIPLYLDRSSGVNVSGNSTGAIFADFDNNTYVDLFVAQGTPNSQLFLRNGSSWENLFNNQSEDFTNISIAKVTQAADIDNDGLLDIAYIDASGIMMGQNLVSGNSTADVWSTVAGGKAVPDTQENQVLVDGMNNLEGLEKEFPPPSPESPPSFAITEGGHIFLTEGEIDFRDEGPEEPPREPPYNLTIIKSVQQAGPYNIGDTLTFVINVTNTGGNATNITITDILNTTIFTFAVAVPPPDSTSVGGGYTNYTWIANISNGTSFVILMNVTAIAAGSAVNEIVAGNGSLFFDANITITIRTPTQRRQTGGGGGGGSYVQDVCELTIKNNCYGQELQIFSKAVGMQRSANAYGYRMILQDDAAYGDAVQQLQTSKRMTEVPLTYTFLMGDVGQKLVLTSSRTKEGKICPLYPNDIETGTAWTKCCVVEYDCIIPVDFPTEIERACGDGKLSPGEECEMGLGCEDPTKPFCNTHSCTCQSEMITPEDTGKCGDGLISGAEQCEIGTSCEDRSMICSNCNCIVPVREPVCGDDILEGPEQCESDADCAERIDAPYCNEGNCMCTGDISFEDEREPKPEEEIPRITLCEGETYSEDYTNLFYVTFRDCICAEPVTSTPIKHIVPGPQAPCDCDCIGERAAYDAAKQELLEFQDNIQDKLDKVKEDLAKEVDAWIEKAKEIIDIYTAFDLESFTTHWSDEYEFASDQWESQASLEGSYAQSSGAFGFGSWSGGMLGFSAGAIGKGKHVGGAPLGGGAGGPTGNIVRSLITGAVPAEGDGDADGDSEGDAPSSKSEQMKALFMEQLQSAWDSLMAKWESQFETLFDAIKDEIDDMKAKIEDYLKEDIEKENELVLEAELALIALKQCCEKCKEECAAPNCPDDCGAGCDDVDENAPEAIIQQAIDDMITEAKDKVDEFEESAYPSMPGFGEKGAGGGGGGGAGSGAGGLGGMGAGASPGAVAEEPTEDELTEDELTEIESIIAADISDRLAEAQNIIDKLTQISLEKEYPIADTIAKLQAELDRDEAILDASNELIKYSVDNESKVQAEEVVASVTQLVEERTSMEELTVQFAKLLEYFNDENAVEAIGELQDLLTGSREEEYASMKEYLTKEENSITGAAIIGKRRSEILCGVDTEGVTGSASVRNVQKAAKDIGSDAHANVINAILGFPERREKDSRRLEKIDFNLDIDGMPEGLSGEAEKKHAKKVIEQGISRERIALNKYEEYRKEKEKQLTADVLEEKKKLAALDSEILNLRKEIAKVHLDQLEDAEEYYNELILTEGKLLGQKFEFMNEAERAHLNKRDRELLQDINNNPQAHMLDGELYIPPQDLLLEKSYVVDYIKRASNQYCDDLMSGSDFVTDMIGEFKTAPEVKLNELNKIDLDELKEIHKIREQVWFWKANTADVEISPLYTQTELTGEGFTFTVPFSLVPQFIPTLVIPILTGTHDESGESSENVKVGNLITGEAAVSIGQLGNNLEKFMNKYDLVVETSVQVDTNFPFLHMDIVQSEMGVPSGQKCGLVRPPFFYDEEDKPIFYDEEDKPTFYDEYPDDGDEDDPDFKGEEDEPEDRDEYECPPGTTPFSGTEQDAADQGYQMMSAQDAQYEGATNVCFVMGDGLICCVEDVPTFQDEELCECPGRHSTWEACVAAGDDAYCIERPQQTTKKIFDTIEDYSPEPEDLLKPETITAEIPCAPGDPDKNCEAGPGGQPKCKIKNCPLGQELIGYPSPGCYCRDVPRFSFIKIFEGYKYDYFDPEEEKEAELEDDRTVQLDTSTTETAIALGEDSQVVGMSITRVVSITPGVDLVRSASYDVLLDESTITGLQIYNPVQKSDMMQVIENPSVDQSKYGIPTHEVDISASSVKASYESTAAFTGDSGMIDYDSVEYMPELFGDDVSMTDRVIDETTDLADYTIDAISEMPRQGEVIAIDVINLAKPDDDNLAKPDDEVARMDIPKGTSIEFAYYIQDMRIQGREIQKEGQAASLQLQNVYDDIGKLFALEFEQIIDVQKNIQKNIKNASSVFYFTDQFFEDLNLIFDRTHTTQKLRAISEQIGKLSQFVVEADPMSKAQADSFKKQLDTIKADLESVRSQLPDVERYLYDVGVESQDVEPVDTNVADIPLDERQNVFEGIPQDASMEQKDSPIGVEFRRGKEKFLLGDYEGAFEAMTTVLRAETRADAMWILANSALRINEPVIADTVLTRMLQQPDAMTAVKENVLFRVEVTESNISLEEATINQLEINISTAVSAEPEDRVIHYIAGSIFDVCLPILNEFVYEEEVYTFMGIHQDLSRGAAEYYAESKTENGSTINLPMVNFKNALADTKLGECDELEKRKQKGEDPREFSGGTKQTDDKGNELVCVKADKPVDVLQDADLSVSMISAAMTAELGTVDYALTFAKDADTYALADLDITDDSLISVDDGVSTYEISGESYRCVDINKLPAPVAERSAEQEKVTAAPIPQTPIKKYKFKAYKVELEFETAEDVYLSPLDIYEYEQFYDKVKRYEKDKTPIPAYELPSFMYRYEIGKNLVFKSKTVEELTEEDFENLELINISTEPDCLFKKGSVECGDPSKTKCEVDSTGKLVCTTRIGVGCLPGADIQTGLCVTEACLAGCQFDIRDAKEGKVECAGYENCTYDGTEIVCETVKFPDCTFNKDMTVNECGDLNCTIEEEVLECRLFVEAKEINESVKEEGLPEDCERTEEGIECDGYLTGFCEEIDGQVICDQRGKVPSDYTLGDCELVDGRVTCGEFEGTCGFEDGEVTCWPMPMFEISPEDDCTFIDGTLWCGGNISRLQTLPDGCSLIENQVVCVDPIELGECQFIAGRLDCPDYPKGTCGFTGKNVTCIEAKEIELPEGCSMVAGEYECSGYELGECGYVNGKFQCETGVRENLPEGCEFTEDKIICSGAELSLPEDCSIVEGAIHCGEKTDCYFVHGQLRCV